MKTENEFRLRFNRIYNGPFTYKIKKDVILLLVPEFSRLFLVQMRSFLQNLNMKEKRELNPGLSSKETSSCKWLIT